MNTFYLMGIGESEAFIQLQLKDLVADLDIVSLKEILKIETEGEFVVFAAFDSVVEGVDMWYSDESPKDGQRLLVRVFCVM
jgi:hypothetical protein